MVKKPMKATPTSAPPASDGNHVRFCLLWRLVEFEGEGMTAVVGCLVLGVVLVGWLVLSP
jgi:hypothetical protein